MNAQDRWFDGVARNLIQRAALKAPPALSERLGEEWLADLTGRSGVLSQLRFALGCCWATTVIAHEFGAPVRAAAAASGSKTTVVDPAGAGWSFSRRTTVILVIVGLHVLVVCVLAAGIVPPKPRIASPPPVDLRFHPRPEPPVPPTPVGPTLTNPRAADVPLPRGPELPKEEAISSREPVSQVPMQHTGPPSPRPVHRVIGGPGVGFPNTADFYPPESIRRHEMGSTTVGVCVDAAGRLIGRPTIGESSGYARLDHAAVEVAQAGSGHYRATIEDGRAVSACYPYRVRFQLPN